MSFDICTRNANADDDGDVCQVELGTVEGELAVEEEEGEQQRGAGTGSRSAELSNSLLRLRHRQACCSSSSCCCCYFALVSAVTK